MGLGWGEQSQGRVVGRVGPSWDKGGQRGGSGLSLCSCRAGEGQAGSVAWLGGSRAVAACTHAGPEGVYFPSPVQARTGWRVSQARG